MVLGPHMVVVLQHLAPGVRPLAAPFCCTCPEAESLLGHLGRGASSLRSADVLASGPWIPVMHSQRLLAAFRWGCTADCCECSVLGTQLTRTGMLRGLQLRLPAARHCHSPSCTAGISHGHHLRAPDGAPLPSTACSLGRAGYGRRRPAASSLPELDLELPELEEDLRTVQAAAGAIFEVCSPPSGPGLRLAG